MKILTNLCYKHKKHEPLLQFSVLPSERIHSKVGDRGWSTTSIYKASFCSVGWLSVLLLLTKTTCPSDWDRGGSLLGPAGRGGVIKGAGSVLVLRRFSQVLMRYIVDAGSLHVWGVNRRLEEVKVQGGAYQ